MAITFVICTYNRAFILEECLQSVFQQIGELEHYEVLVVDNNSTDETQKLVREMQSEYPVLRLVLEKQIGLSHARNRAMIDGVGEWLVYIDDDARLGKGYVERLLSLIESQKYDCLGGMYYAWFRFGKPKWLPKNFGNKELIRESAGRIDGNNGWLSGGNMAIRKKVLKELGGFLPELGMAGEKAGYGEENYLQEQLLKKGYTIGFDPELIIEHAVLPHKLRLSWHLKNKYVMGKYSRALSNEKKVGKTLFMIFKSLAGGIFKRLPQSTFKLLSRKNYYYQNLLIDVFAPTLWFLGYFRGIKKTDKKHDGG